MDQRKNRQDTGERYDDRSRNAGVNRQQRAGGPARGNVQQRAGGPVRENVQQRAGGPVRGNEQQRTGGPARENVQQRVGGPVRENVQPRENSPVRMNTQRREKGQAHVNVRLRGNGPARGNAQKRGSSQVHANTQIGENSPVRENRQMSKNNQIRTKARMQETTDAQNRRIRIFYSILSGIGMGLATLVITCGVLFGTKLLSRQVKADTGTIAGLLLDESAGGSTDREAELNIGQSAGEDVQNEREDALNAQTDSRGAENSSGNDGSDESTDEKMTGLDIGQSEAAADEASEDAGAGNEAASSDSSQTDSVVSSENPSQVADWNLILVNRWNPIPEGYDMELTQLRDGHAVDSRIYPDLQQMFDDARAQGILPMISSSFRTAEYQQSLMDEKIAEYQAQGYSDEEARAQAEQWVAIPGTSEHQIGLAVDITTEDSLRQDASIVWQWLAENSYKYGFILRYQEQWTEITGVMPEPWHFRYVGYEAAREIYEQGVSLEEYLGRAEHGV